MPFLGLFGLLVLLLTYATGLSFRRMGEAFLEEHRRRLTEAEHRVGEKRERLEKKRAAGQTLEHRLGRIVTLYELTKKLTASLGFSEIFLLLQEALRNNLSYEEGWLTGPILEGSFCLSPKKEIPLEEARLPTPPSFLEALLQETARQKHLVRQEGIVAVPLLVKNELNGCLVLKGCPSAQEESLSIVASQFAPAIQKVKLYEKIQELAITDGLTRVSSRRYFLERFQEELARSKRYQLSLAFLMADIDHFKEHNDRCGHLVGDVVLREVASLIKTSVREIDLVGRYGGEEFAIVLPDTSLEGALQVAERIRSSVEGHPFAAYDEVLRVTLSLGVGVFPENGEEAMGLIDVADSALYHAKRSGRNRVSTSRMLP